MRAWVQPRYGPANVLELQEVPQPVPAKGEVLVKIAATSVNLSDWEGLHGRPGYARLAGLRRPRRRPILGSDIAGRVVGVGDGVARFSIGDEVFGDSNPRCGGFAEYVALKESMLAPKPATLTFAEAAAIPQAGAIASQAVARANPGDRLLINGAGGGSGAFAIQLAVEHGVHVTAVDNAGKLAFLRTLGAHDVIDYERTDFTRTGPYDAVVDLIASRSVFAYHRALARGGRYAMVGGTLRTIFRILTVGTLVGLLTRRRLVVAMIREGPKHFMDLAERCAEGTLDIHIDRTFSLDDVPAALRLHGEGRAHGKVVVLVGDK